MPKVSIIMGIYNCEKTLNECLDSVLNQSFSDWELIMCDDGSIDSTYKIASEYRERFPDKIILLKNETNKRLAATLNRCLKKASGDYIARMDSDDICLENRLSEQVNFLDNHLEYDLVGCRRIIFNENGILGIRGSIGEPPVKTLLTNVPFAHPTVMVRRDVYSKLGGYSETEKVTRCEDLNLWFKFYKAQMRGYNLEIPLLKYRETIGDFNKRKFKYAFETTLVFFNGYKLLGFKKRYYFYALKPILTTIVPFNLLKKIQFKNLKEINRS